MFSAEPPNACLLPRSMRFLMAVDPTFRKEPIRVKLDDEDKLLPLVFD